MGQLAPNKHWIRSGSSRLRRRHNRWPEPKETKNHLTLVVRASAGGSQWPTASLPLFDAQCETIQTEISHGYIRAIALLRSLRNVSEEEAQKQRESWELLKQDLDENRYH